MNKRGFLATLAAMCVAPFAVKADPIEARRKRALALSNVPRATDLEQAWINGEWREVTQPWRWENKGPGRFLEELAESDHATITRIEIWGMEGKTHYTALGHWDNGDVWVQTVTMPREP